MKSSVGDATTVHLAVRHAMARLRFLDNIERRLKFPAEYRDERYQMPAIGECLRIVTPWPSRWAPSIRNVDIRKVAQALLHADEVPEDAHYGFKFILPRRESPTVPNLEIKDADDFVTCPHKLVHPQ